LAERKPLDDKTCLFCSEPKSASHLFFGCCVAKLFWQTIAEVIGLDLGADFASVARFWISEKKHRIVNICTVATLWDMWKLGNEI
jgi:hypothetical protein